MEGEQSRVPGTALCVELKSLGSRWLASLLPQQNARELEAGSPSQLTLKAPGRRRTGNTKGPFDFFERRLGRKVEEPGKQFVSWDSSVEDFRTYFPHPVKPVGPLENFPSKAATPVLQT